MCHTVFIKFSSGSIINYKLLQLTLVNSLAWLRLGLVLGIFVSGEVEDEVV